MSKKYYIKNNKAIEVSDEIHEYFTTSDRQMRYCDEERKQSDWEIDMEKEKVTEIPSLEDSFDIPDHFGTYWSSAWETVDEEEISTFDIDLWEFIAGFNLNNPKPDIILPGGDRLDIPAISSDRITITLGKATLVADIFLNLSNIRVNYDRIKFTYMKSGNMYKVYISGGSSSNDSMINQYADDKYKYMTVEARINHCSELYIGMLKSSIKEEYTRLTGKNTNFSDYYDIGVKANSLHRGAPAYYYWINSEGKLMEKFNSYPGDQVVIGKYELPITFSRFEPLLIIVHDTDSHEASAKYQKLVESILEKNRT